MYTVYISSKKKIGIEKCGVLTSQQTTVPFLPFGSANVQNFRSRCASSSSDPRSSTTSDGMLWLLGAGGDSHPRAPCSVCSAGRRSDHKVRSRRVVFWLARGSGRNVDRWLVRGGPARAGSRVRCRASRSFAALAAGTRGCDGGRFRRLSCQSA